MMKKQNVRTLSFIVSTFTYLLIGAAIFDALESQAEQETKDKLDRNESYFKQAYNISIKDYNELEEIIIRYHPYHLYPQWKFAGSFYFSLTVITTIGYGHSTPQTTMGKCFCMIYAMVGIPLCLTMFQSVGDRLNYFASFCIKLFKKFLLRIKHIEVSQTEMVCVAGMFALFVITGGAAMFSHYENWSYFDSIYYCVITLTTIGFGDYVALQEGRSLSNTIYVILSFTFILFGLTVVASTINLLVLKFLTMNTADSEREEYSRKKAAAEAAQSANGETSDAMRFSNSDLLNVVTNGDLLYSMDPEDLEDLRRENNVHLSCASCLSSSCFMSFLQSAMPCLNLTDRTSHNNNNSSSNSGRNRRRTSSKLSQNRALLLASTAQTKDMLDKNKLHYTVRRGPTEIAHLLTGKNTDKQQQQLEAVTSDKNRTELVKTRRDNNNKESSDVNIYIDEEDNSRSSPVVANTTAPTDLV